LSQPTRFPAGWHACGEGPTTNTMVAGAWEDSCRGAGSRAAMRLLISPTESMATVAVVNELLRHAHGMHGDSEMQAAGRCCSRGPLLVTFVPL
jgi:hypothetical protein